MKKIYFFVFFLLIGKAFAQVEPIGTARVKSNGSVVTVAGIVTNDAAHDNRNRNRCFQDATGGLNIFAQNSAAAPTLQSLKPGDSVVVTGTLAEFNNLKQLVEPLTITRVAENKTVPKAKVVTIADLQNPATAELLESMLVRVEDVIFDTGDAIFGSGTSGRSYDFDDPKAPVSGNCFPNSADCSNGPIYRINPGNPLVGTDIPKGTVSLSGYLGQFATAYQITAISRQDLELGLVISDINQTNIQPTNFTLSFNTNQNAKTRLRWGNIFLVDVVAGTPNYDTTFVGEANKFSTPSTEHSFQLSGLNEAQAYFVEFYAETTDGTKNNVATDVFSTASQSTGEIKVFFNRTVDASFSRNGAVANVTNNIAAEIARYIDRATVSVDVALYSINSTANVSLPVINALNAAAARNVRVRIIYDGERALGIPMQTALGLLNHPNIIKMKDRNGAGTGALQRANGVEQHNKFIIIDPDSRLDSWVLTGSGNFTNNNLATDPNNFVFVQDQAFARAYRIEFDEMWGEGPATGSEDRRAKSRFGIEKIKNTPSKFIIGDRLVELYFSPSDKTNNVIQKTILTTDNDLRFNLLILTADDLAVAIDSMQNVGWDVKGLIDEDNAKANPAPPAVSFGFDYFFLRERGVNVNSYTGDQLHHKYAVIDAVRTNSDPLVITGSHNWTTGANNENDENTLIIHDAKIANMYRQEFGQRWFEATGVRDAYVLALDEPTDEKSAVIYPNPSQGKFKIQFDQVLSSDIVVKVVDLQGKTLENQTTNLNGSQLEMDMNLPKGLYILQIQIGEKTFTRKMVVTK